MKYPAILLLIIILGGCGVKVNTLQDKAADFSKYKTFCWLEGCEFAFSGPSYLDDSLWRETLKEAIIAEFAENGITHDESNPDLLVDFHITIENETSITYNQIDEPYDFQPFPEVHNEVINYLKGTMIIDVVDRSQGKMVWRSESIGYMDIHPELSEKNIRRGIKMTLKKFPKE